MLFELEYLAFVSLLKQSARELHHPATKQASAIRFSYDEKHLPRGDIINTILLHTVLETITFLSTSSYTASTPCIHHALHLPIPSSIHLRNSKREESRTHFFHGHRCWIASVPCRVLRPFFGGLRWRARYPSFFYWGLLASRGRGFRAPQNPGGACYPQEACF